MGLATATRTLLCAACLVAGGSCIDELELDASDASALYVDGAVLVDSATQRLTLGRINGFDEATTPIVDAEVAVTDLSTGARHVYAESTPGHYEAAYLGRFGRGYRLDIALPGQGTYRSRADSIAPVDLSISGQADLRRIPDRDGNLVNTGIAGASLAVSLGAGAAEGILVINPRLAWSYFDLICGPFDGVAQCWFEEPLNDGNFTVVDLATLREGSDTARLLVGPTGTDHRLAEVAWFVAEIRRYGPAAAPYFSSLARAANPSGSIFDERPRSVAGNVEAAEGEGEPILGYFGVAESLPRYFPTSATPIIRQRSGQPVCSEGRDGIAVEERFDCCFCENTPGASTEKPSYLP